MRLLKFCLILIIYSFISSCSKPEVVEEYVNFPSGERVLINDFTTNIAGLSNTYAIMKTSKGSLTFRFYTKNAPRTSARIMQLIQDGFYNGMVIHRAIPNYLIQLGDPTGTGKGGSGQTLKSEFNQIQHIQGTLAMARGIEENTEDSQFYISLTTLSHLDGKYTVFGQIIEGLEVLNQLSLNDKVESITLHLQQ